MDKYRNLIGGLIIIAMAQLLFIIDGSILPDFIIYPLYIVSTLLGLANIAVEFGKPSFFRQRWQIVEGLTFFVVSIFFVMMIFIRLKDPASIWSYLVAAAFGFGAVILIYLGLYSIRSKAEVSWSPN